MPTRPVQPEMWAALLASYRTRPGNATHAARAADCDWRTAHRGWHKGFRWSKDPAHHTPIKDIVEGEQAYARARIAEDEAAAAKARAEAEGRNTDEAAKAEAQRRLEVSEAAKVDITQSRAQEAQMIRLARGSATAILVTLTQVAQGAAKVGERVRKGLEALNDIDPTTGQAKPITPGEAANLVRLIANLTSALDKANGAAQKAMEMERLLLGEPQAIIGQVNLGDLTVDEAGRRIAAATKAWERFQREKAEDAAAALSPQAVGSVAGELGALGPVGGSGPSSGSGEMH